MTRYSRGVSHPVQYQWLLICDSIIFFTSQYISCHYHCSLPDSNASWANVGPTSGRQYRRWANVGPIYIAVWTVWLPGPHCRCWFACYYHFITCLSYVTFIGQLLLSLLLHGCWLCPPLNRFYLISSILSVQFEWNENMDSMQWYTMI